MKTSIPRLSKATFRDGRTIHVIRNTRAEACQRAYRCQTEHIAKAREGEMIGFAIVAWGVGGGVSTSLSCFDGSQVGIMMAPEFVKTALVDFIASGD
jgi:hypothetical protein